MQRRNTPITGRIQRRKGGERAKKKNNWKKAEWNGRERDDRIRKQRRANRKQKNAEGRKTEEEPERKKKKKEEAENREKKNRRQKTEGRNREEEAPVGQGGSTSRPRDRHLASSSPAARPGKTSSSSPFNSFLSWQNSAKGIIITFTLCRARVT